MLNFSREEVSPITLQKMTDSIAHRGPDGEGWYRQGPVGLGHRRLAILDLSSSAHQPMISLDGRYAISYNGEVYNYPEIRAQLQSRGHKFHSKSDTEVVLLSWIEWGTECLKMFNGMFAFAIWDSHDQRLWLARDRYGIKPLYISQTQKTFIFGSEQKALLCHPAVSRKFDKDAIFEYFTFQNIFTDKTFNTNIKMFPAGHFGRIDIHNKELVLEKYWDFNFQSDSNETDISEYEEELDRLLRQAVSRQLLSDVEIGSYLSGGMDSGTLTALASRELPYIKTFTCGFDLSSAAGIELGFDERIKAEAMSSLFKTEHYEMVLKSGDMERCLDHVVRQIEEPRVGQSYPNYYVAQLASKFVKVVLSGAGGDELFGGYPWRYFRSIGVSDFNTFIDDYYGYWNRLMTSGELKRLFAPIWNDVRSVDTKQIFSNVFSTSNNLLNEPRDYINHSLYFEAKTFLHGLFVVEDKLSMAHGLETRVPFMDNDLVDFAMSCPLELKIKNFGQVPKINENDAGNKSDRYFQKTNDGKNILRSVMASYIPASITNAQKKGFSSPDASWFKGESIDFVKARLLLKTSPIYELVDYKSVNDLLEAHFQGKSNRRLLIWSLLSLDSLLREEIN